MPITNALAGIAVADLKTAIPWYERLLGRAADARPLSQVAEWRFANGGWIQVFADGGRAGSSSVTLVVDDMETHLRTLADRHFAVADKTASATVKTATVRDLDGNQIVFAQGFDQRHR